jgi:hypothetical protein
LLRRRRTLGDVRQTSDPQGRRWIIRYEGTDALAQSWGVLLPWPLDDIVLGRYVYKHGLSAIIASASDGSEVRIELGWKADVLTAMDSIAAAIEAGQRLPKRIN